MADSGGRESRASKGQATEAIPAESGAQGAVPVGVNPLWQWMATRTLAAGAGTGSGWEAQADRTALQSLGGAVPGPADLRQAASEGAGAPSGGALPAAARLPAERVLGLDFSGVRVHTGVAAQSQTEGAHAVASGRDLYFAPGRYAPNSRLGQALIAHELTHVAQQGAAPALRKPPDPAAAALRRMGRGAAPENALWRNRVRAFRDAHRAEDLAAERESILDPAEDLELTPAPRGMRQRCDDGPSSKPPAPASSAPSLAPPSGSGSAAPAPAPVPVQGQAARAAAKTLIEQDATAKAQRDILEHSLDEIRSGKALGFHQGRNPPPELATAATALALSKADIAAREADWAWFLTQGPPGSKPRASDGDWSKRKLAFLAALVSPLGTLVKKFPKGQAKNWLKNTPANVYQIFRDVGDAQIPPAFLYALAAREGMVDQYIRPQVPGAAPDALTDAQMATVSVDKPVSGFNALGLDDFFSDMESKRQPLSGFFPPGFDVKKLTEVSATNEQGRTVRSADASDLKTGVQALYAVIARRRAMFDEDRRALGYPTPTADQYVYFSYVYYNSGHGEGKRTLTAHEPAHKDATARRTLDAWISKGEYPNAIILLQSYRMIKESGVLPGYP